jgi:hypothetical protein
MISRGGSDHRWWIRWAYYLKKWLWCSWRHRHFRDQWHEGDDPAMLLPWVCGFCWPEVYVEGTIWQRSDWVPRSWWGKTKAKRKETQK